MGTSSLMINTLIIETRTNGRPDLFVPMMVASEDENKLIEYMAKAFTSKLELMKVDHDCEIISAFMDTTCARIDYKINLDDHSIYWTLCKSKMI